MFGFTSTDLIGRNVTAHIMPMPYARMHDSILARYLDTGSGFVSYVLECENVINVVYYSIILQVELI